MPCRICKCTGHNARTCRSIIAICTPDDTRIRRKKDTRNTEELGKVVENQICKSLSIPFVGSYKYESQLPEKVKSRFEKAMMLFQYNKINHTGSKMGRYDITGTNDDGTTGFLSIKSSKMASSKICPQVIGQPCHNVFCDYFKIPRSSDKTHIKKFIIENIHTILYDYFNHTFDCDIFYYNEYYDKCLYIKTIQPIDWSSMQLKFTRMLEDWNESNTLHAVGVSGPKAVTIGEFQIHDKRNSIKFRWNFNVILSVFNTAFSVQEF